MFFAWHYGPVAADGRLTRDEFQAGFGRTTFIRPRRFSLLRIWDVPENWRSRCSELLRGAVGFHNRLGTASRRERQEVCPFRPLIIRLAISTSFLYAAQGNTFLGSKLSLATIPRGAVGNPLYVAL